jgi:uncharacterized damage-inducible protein DinB
METTAQLANRLREVLLNGTWIANTNYKMLLSDLSRNEATAKVGSLNSIASLTFHINYYLAGMLRVFKGGSLDIRDKYSFDLPEIKSEEDWQKLVNELCSNAEKFATHVEDLSEEQLDDVFTEEKYGTYRRNIEGVIEHSYYHLGQVSLIKKMIAETQDSK